MNEKAKAFIQNIGLLCEEWSVIYRSFRSQGLDEKEALIHTQAFMATVLADIRQNNENK